MTKKNDENVVKRRHTANPHLKFMIDSGAHSMQKDASGKFAKWTVQDWENYLESYTKWAIRNKDHIFALVELDIEYVVKSQTIIEKWQDQYFRPVEEAGIPVIYVWHPQLGYEYWEKMCAKFPYVGLPGEMSAHADFNGYMAVARRWTTRVHGFAATKQSDFRDWPWFCMTDEHTVLTKRGWVTRQDISTDDYAYVRLNDGTAEWQPVQAVHEYDVTDVPMVEFSNRTFFSQTTEDHRWLSLRKRGRKRVEVPEFRTTRQLNDNDRIPRCAPYVGNSDKIYTDVFVEIAAWFWTEGTVCNKRGRVTISQSFKVNPEKEKRIRLLLHTGNIRFCEWQRPDGCTYFQIETAFSHRLTQVIPDKVVPLSFLLALTKEQLQLFIKTSIAADGTRTPRASASDTFCLSQSDKRRSDSFEFACILAGYPVTRFDSVVNGTRMFSVNVSNVSLIYPSEARRREFRHTGKIWCVSTRGQNFLTRCRDKVYFTGNSVDSVTWKTSEMYGVLIDWDDKKQKLSFIEDKAKRVMFRHKFETFGLNADAIINDGKHPNPNASEAEKKEYNRIAYRHVTKYALISMRMMEKFYEERYSNRMQYYDLRLPNPVAFFKSMQKRDALGWWERFRPKDCFALDADETDPTTLRRYLFALSCIQHQRLDLMTPTAKKFALAYFGFHLSSAKPDSGFLARDLAMKTLPPNPIAIKRESVEDFSDNINAPRSRDQFDEAIDFTEDDFPDFLLT